MPKIRGAVCSVCSLAQQSLVPAEEGQGGRHWCSPKLWEKQSSWMFSVSRGQLHTSSLLIAEPAESKCKLSSHNELCKVQLAGAVPKLGYWMASARSHSHCETGLVTHLVRFKTQGQSEGWCCYTDFFPWRKLSVLVLDTSALWSQPDTVSLLSYSKNLHAFSL